MILSQLQVNCGIWQDKGNHYPFLYCISDHIMFYLPALPHEVVFRPSYVYHEWPVLNWYQFELSFLFSCKLLIFTPLIKSTMRWCEYESVYKGIVLSFSLGLTWRNLSIHCYKWGTYLSIPLIDILFNLARSCNFQCRAVAVFSTLHIVFVISYPIMNLWLLPYSQWT